MIDLVRRTENLTTIRMMAPNYTISEIAAHTGLHINTVCCWANLHQIKLLSSSEAHIIEAKRWKRMWGDTPRRRSPPYGRIE